MTVVESIKSISRYFIVFVWTLAVAVASPFLAVSTIFEFKVSADHPSFSFFFVFSLTMSVSTIFEFKVSDGQLSHFFCVFFDDECHHHL